MTLCPACGYNNIQGSDACEKCGTDLFSLGSERKPVTDDTFEVAILNDKLDMLDLQDALCIPDSTKLKDAIKLLDEQKKGAAYILKNDAVIGIVTAHDIMQRAIKMTQLSLDAPITGFMSKNIESLPIDARVVDAMHLVNVGGHEYLLITTKTDKKYKYLGIRGIINYIMKKNPNLMKMQAEGEKKYLKKS